ncbi:type I-E CRISPR-associated protein Cse1/CasA [Lactobacillus sp. ESL0684]|uniref:type I-E CRISPR-associated protein Cse1/CasA n=1 Tax=Lactobacillus sp. ESL0684 TaxID=2983213 RepID=UPI0023F70EEC|nr:type I-E CRISPR-associated protein Cse1/CasA [Lactobacillus sp. ESL0684]WEV43557.1 type I-E CRISPR-associated protein Cse1/CasA [Lactobacillus sp. ESL0684]
MTEKTFNLTTQPWIKVINADTNREQKVSLIELFENAQDYRQLAGEMRIQDFAILRLLLAILTTVYSRFDANNQPYEDLKVDPISMQITSDIDEEEEEDFDENLLATWQQLYSKGSFSEIVVKYLQQYEDRFDFFGSHPFYQVTRNEYNELVPDNCNVKTGKGRVAIKQINRQVSESNNSPAIFAPRAGQAKNIVELDELIRWIITYQNYAGVTDKTRIKADEKFSSSPGWLYKLNPVFAKGETLFETLMLNLILVNGKYAPQKPIWEYQNVQEYIAVRKKKILPNNISELYTAWSRILHIEWDELEQPTIFSAGIPMFDSMNAKVEPMTIWKGDRESNIKPSTRGLKSLGNAMWRKFSNYVSVNGISDDIEPGVVCWLRNLKDEGIIASDKNITLASIDLLDDGNSSSQLPAAELYDDMSIEADVMFDTSGENCWPAIIEEMIKKNQVIGNVYWQFLKAICELRGLSNQSFANKASEEFYYGLNEPFKTWLAKLSNEEDSDQAITSWKRWLKKYALGKARSILDTSTPRDITGRRIEKNGVKKLRNVVTAYNYFCFKVNQDLEINEK